MDKVDFAREQAAFAYKNSSRALIVLGTILVAITLTLINAPLTKPPDLQSVHRYLDSATALIETLPRTVSTEIDTSVASTISGWSFPNAVEISVDECDSIGALHYLFRPEEKSTDVNQLLGRLKVGLNIVSGRKTAESVNLPDVHLAWCVSRGNSGDSSVLARAYRHKDYSDSANEAARRTFGLVNFRKFGPLVNPPGNPREIEVRWSTIVDSLTPFWNSYRDSLQKPMSSQGEDGEMIEGPVFSIGNVRRLLSQIDETKPPLGTVDLGGPVKTTGDIAFLSLAPVILLLMLLAQWHLLRAREFEESFYAMNGQRPSGRIGLSSVSSGFFFLFQKVSLLIGMPFLLVLVVIWPTWLCYVVPSQMSTIFPQEWRAILTLIYYAITLLVLCLGLDLTVSIPILIRKRRTREYLARLGQEIKGIEPFLSLKLTTIQLLLSDSRKNLVNLIKDL